MYRLKVVLDGKTVLLATVTSDQLMVALESITQIWPALYVDVRRVQE